MEQGRVANLSMVTYGLDSITALECRKVATPKHIGSGYTRPSRFDNVAAPEPKFTFLPTPPPGHEDHGVIDRMGSSDKILLTPQQSSGLLLEAWQSLDLPSTAHRPTTPESPNHHLCRPALIQSILDFKRVVCGSALVKSALAALESRCMHPPEEKTGSRGLQWTLASMLALHIKVTTTQKAPFKATVASALASLWILQSMSSSDNSSITALLKTYVEFLPAFDSSLAINIFNTWATSSIKLRKCIIDSQMEVLKGVAWSARLDFEKDVLPCYMVLFLGKAEGFGFEEFGDAEALDVVRRVQMQAYDAADVAAQRAAVAAMLGGGLHGQAAWVVQLMQVCNAVWGAVVVSAQKAAQQAQQQGLVYCGNATEEMLYSQEQIQTAEKDDDDENEEEWNGAFKPVKKQRYL